MTNRLSRFCDTLAWGMFCVLMADVCIFGAGKLISVGPLSFRMILLALTSVVCLPVIFKNFKTLFKSKYTWVVGGFGLWLILSTVIGIRNGNNISLLVTDWKGFLYFLLFPSAICLVRNRQRAQTLTKVMMYSAGVMALVHILCILCYLWMPELLDRINPYAKSVHFFYVSYEISETNVRISFLSLVCQLIGCAFSVYYQLQETKPWKRCVYVVITAVCLFAIWLSYTRSIYLAAGVAALGTVIMLLIRADRTARRRIAAHLCSSLALFFVLIAAFRIGTGTNYFSYGLSRTFAGVNLPSISAPSEPSVPDDIPEETTDAETEPDEEPDEAPDEEPDSFHSSTVSSDQLRATTVDDLIDRIQTSPVWGHGLGTAIPSRPDGLNEYFFLDLGAKTGLVGLALYLAPIALMLWSVIQKLKERWQDSAFYGLWLVIILGFVAYSYFTPCMNSSVGIMCYCCAMAVFQQASATKNNV